MTSAPPRLWLLAGLLLPLTALAASGPRPRTEQATRTDQAGDPLPRFARARLGSPRYQHGSAVTSVGYLPGAKEVASFGQDRILRVWERATGRELRSFSMSVLWITSPDNHFAAVFYETAPFQIVDLTGATAPRPIADVRLTGTMQISAAFSGDGKILAVCGDEGDGTKVAPIRLWDVSTGKERAALVPPLGVKEGKKPARRRFFAAALVFSPDGRTLLEHGLVSTDEAEVGELRTWDVASGKMLPAPQGQNGVGRQLVFAPDSKSFLALNAVQSGEGVKLAVWETATGKKLREFTAFDDVSSVLYLSPNGKHLATLEPGNSVVRLWDVSTGKELPAPPFGAAGVYAVAFAPDSRTLAVAFEENDPHIGLWDVAAGKEVRDIKTSPGDFFGNFPTPGDMPLGGGLAFTPDGKELATAGASGVHRWDPATGKEVHAGDAPPRGQVLSLALSPDGKQVVTASADQAIRLWDVAAGKELRRFLPPEDAEYPLADGVAFSPDGRLLAIGWYDGQIQLWDMTTGKELRVLKGHPAMVSSLAFAPNGKTLASADAGGDVIWWDLTKGRMLRRFAEAPPPLNPNEAVPARATGQPRVAFAADGKVLAGLIVKGENYRAYVWELATGEVRRDLLVKPETAPVEVQAPNDSGQDATCVKLSPDGRTLVWIAGASVRFWDLVHDKDIRGLDLAGELIEEVVFSPDGRWFAGAGRKGSVRVWDTSTGTVRARLTGHRGSVASIAFSADGRSLVSGGSDGTVLVWDADAAVIETALAKEGLAVWNDLGAPDAKQGYQAICHMVSTPHESVAWLSEHLKPAAPADATRLARLIADLESERFAVRHKATQELEKLGDLAEAAVRQRLADNPPLEISQRLEKVLDRLAGPVTDPEKLQAIRAVEVLEQIGTAEARAVLCDVARGTPEARLTREAKEALQRLSTPR